MLKKRSLILLCLLISILSNAIYSLNGAYLTLNIGMLEKIDVASAFSSKRSINMMDIPTGIGEYGMADSHGFPRVLEALSSSYGEILFSWGYKFRRIFAFGSSILISNLVMPSLTFDFKFNIAELKMIEIGSKFRPFVFISLYTGLFDGFPFGFTAGTGIDIFIIKGFYLTINTKLGSELFISSYYDDGINSNPIWHFDSTYAYGLVAIYLGVGYQFDRKAKLKRRKKIKHNRQRS